MTTNTPPAPVDQSPLIIVHDPCHDGNAAAWCAWKFYKGKCEIVRRNYGEDPPDVDGRHVLMFDLSWERGTMWTMAERAASIRVFDHHKTAAEVLDGLPFATFDMERSGAQLAWDYFFPTEQRPDYIESVADRDLFRFALSDTRMLHAYRDSWPFEVASAEHFYATDPERMVSHGASILRYQRQMVLLILQLATVRKFEGHTVAVVNCPPRFASDVGSSLLTEARLDAEVIDYALMFHLDAAQLWRHELRSRKGGVDVSMIANFYGGGGHAAAAGYRSNVLHEAIC